MHDREALCRPGAASEDAHSNQREYSATFRGFEPLQRFCSHGERPISFVRARSHPLAARVASSGFRTLSTPCSPRDLSGLFHPDPARGVLPSEALLCAAPYGPLGPPRPSGVSAPTSRPGPPLQGLARRPQPAARFRLFTRAPRPLTSMGFSPARLLAHRRLQATPPGWPLTRFVDRHQRG
jgi:hypothetical protein